MQIKAISYDTPPLVFSMADDGLNAHDRYRQHIQRNAQIIQRCRAPAVRTAPRGNNRVTVSFTGVRTFATQVLADTFMMDLDSLVPAVALITFTSGNAAVRVLAEASIESIDAEVMGVSILVTLNILGGQFQRMLPNGPTPIPH